MGEAGKGAIQGHQKQVRKLTPYWSALNMPGAHDTNVCSTCIPVNKYHNKGTSGRTISSRNSWTPFMLFMLGGLLRCHQGSGTGPSLLEPAAVCLYTEHACESQREAVTRPR